MKKIEDWVLPIAHSEKVKKCMQLAVERAVRDANDWEAHGAAPQVTEITVLKYLPIFNSLKDCDFENPNCTNHLFQIVIDNVFQGIDERTVLNIMNNTYAIAIHAMNTDYPKYKIPEYRSISSATASNIIAQEMVIAFAVFIIYMEGNNSKNKGLMEDFNFSPKSIAFRILTYFEDLYVLHLNYLLQGISSSTYHKNQKEKLKERRESIELCIKRQQTSVAPLLDAIVRYAEDLPSDEWNAVRAIGRMLHAKGAAARYIPTEVYQQYEQRIDKLANWPSPLQESAKEDNEEKDTANADHTPHDAGELDADEKDAKIRAAIEEWLKGGKRGKGHWFAVYKALVVRNLTSDDMKHFCKQMHDWGYKQEQLTYDSLTKAKPKELPDKPSEWIVLQRTAKGSVLKMIEAYIAFAN